MSETLFKMGVDSAVDYKMWRVKIMMEDVCGTQSFSRSTLRHNQACGGLQRAVQSKTAAVLQDVTYQLVPPNNSHCSLHTDTPLVSVVSRRKCGNKQTNKGSSDKRRTVKVSKLRRVITQEPNEFLYGEINL